MLFCFIRYHILGLYCLRSGLHPILVTFVSCLLLKGKRIYLAEFDSVFIHIYLNKIFHKSTCSVNFLRNRHRLTAVVTFRNARRQMNSLYVWLAIYIYICIQGSPVEIRAPPHWKPISHSRTAPPPELSPRNILPLPSTHCACIHAGKNSARVSKMLTSACLLFRTFVSVQWSTLKSLKTVNVFY